MRASRQSVPPSILAELARIPDVIGILFTGSRAVGKDGPNADWDFHCILKPGKPEWRSTWKFERTWIEVFCNAPKQIRAYFRENVRGGRPMDLTMFSTGIILRDDKSGTLRALVRTAKQLLAAGPPPLSRADRAWLDYDIATYLQDLEDCLAARNPALLLSDYAVNEFVTAWYRFHRVWIPRPKDRLADFRARWPVAGRAVARIHAARSWRGRMEQTIAFGKLLGRTCGLALDGTLHIPPKRRSRKSTRAS